MPIEDTKIRVIAVYNILLNANKPLKVKDISKIISRDYNIDASRKTLYSDIYAITLFENVQYLGNRRGYQIVKPNEGQEKS